MIVKPKIAPKPASAPTGAKLDSPATAVDRTIDLSKGVEKKAFERDGLSLKVGEIVKIIAKQNTSTGYSWKMKEDDAKGIYELTSKNVSRDAGPHVVGVGGHKEIIIKALKPGSTKLRAANVRPWEFKSWDESFDAWGEFNVDVTVKDDVVASPVLGASPQTSAISFSSPVEPTRYGYQSAPVYNRSYDPYSRESADWYGNSYQPTQSYYGGGSSRYSSTPQ